MSHRTSPFASRSIGRVLTLLALLMAPLAHATTLKIATLAPDGSTWMTEMRAAAEAIKQATDGRVEVRYYPGGVMGNDATVMRKIRLGQLQGGALTGSELSLVYRDAQIYSLPFLFNDYAGIDRVRAAADPLLREGFADEGFRVLSISGVGFAYLLSSKPLTSTEDLQKAKVWVPQNDRIAELTFQGGGVQPISLPLSDVFTSLQTGMIDTVGNTPAGTIALQWHTRVKHLFNLPLSYVIGYVVVAEKAFARIDPADQQTVLDAFAAAGERIDADNRRADASALQALQGEGIEVFTPDATEAARWKKVGLDVRQRMLADGEIGAELLKVIDSALADEPAGG